MADTGLFTGWGAPVRGREEKGLEVFNEAVGYYGRSARRRRRTVDGSLSRGVRRARLSRAEFASLP